MKRLVLTASMIATLAAAQTPKPEPKLFRLGMTEAQMIEAFGPPSRVFSGATQVYLTPAEYSELRMKQGIYWRVYSRKTKSNEYEILVELEPDTSESRLHPTMRVGEVRFKFDKDRTPEQLLDEIAEAKVFCAGGCSTGKSFGSLFAVTPDRKVRFSFMDGQVSMADNQALEKIERQ